MRIKVPVVPHPCNPQLGFGETKARPAARKALAGKRAGFRCGVVDFGLAVFAR